MDGWSEGWNLKRPSTLARNKKELRPEHHRRPSATPCRPHSPVFTHEPSPTSTDSSYHRENSMVDIKWGHVHGSASQSGTRQRGFGPSARRRPPRAVQRVSLLVSIAALRALLWQPTVMHLISHLTSLRHEAVPSLLCNASTLPLSRSIVILFASAAQTAAWRLFWPSPSTTSLPATRHGSAKAYGRLKACWRKYVFHEPHIRESHRRWPNNSMPLLRSWAS